MKKNEEYIKWLSGLSSTSKKRVLGVIDRLLEMGKTNPKDSFIRYDSGEYEDSLGVYDDWSIILRLGEEGLLVFDETFHELLLPDYKNLQRAKEFIENVLQEAGEKENRSEAADKMQKPKLTFDEKKNTVIYQTGKDKTRTATFRKGTSEYAILSFLAQNKDTPHTTSELISKLIDVRSSFADADGKKRVIDKVRAIRKKLGKQVIKSTLNGYIIDSEVLIP